MLLNKPVTFLLFYTRIYAQPIVNTFVLLPYETVSCQPDWYQPKGQIPPKDSTFGEHLYININ